jgi:hypothetical protein
VARLTAWKGIGPLIRALAAVPEAFGWSWREMGVLRAEFEGHRG